MWHCWACLLGVADATAVTNPMKADVGAFWEVFLTYEVSCSGAEDELPMDRKCWYGDALEADGRPGPSCPFAAIGRLKL